MYYICITFFLIRVCLIFLLLFRVTVSATTHTPAFLAALQCILALDIVDNAIWFVLYSFLPSSLACVSLCLPLCVSPALALALTLAPALALAPPGGVATCGLLLSTCRVRAFLPSTTDTVPGRVVVPSTRGGYYYIMIP